MSEQKIQSKILAELKKRGCYTVKVVSATVAGVPDIIGCLPDGRFFAIEVKAPGGRPSKLQLVHIDRIRAVGGLAGIAHSWEEAAAILGF